MTFLRQSAFARKQRGFSLAEILTVITILGIITAIAVPNYSNITSGSKSRIAVDLREKLNIALKAYSQINYELNLTRDDSSTTDEYLILRTLQWRDPLDPDSGAPYFDPNYNPTASSDVKTYRLRWNGRVFTVLDAGDAGTGLKVSFEGDDRATPYVFPDGYQPVGP